jgi:hypothetical protein
MTEGRAKTTSTKRLNGLRANSFAAVVMILLEFSLGVGVNLFSTLPRTDHGSGVFTAVGRAVTGGPLLLAAHAALGSLLLVTGTTALVRASLTRRSTLIAVTGIALVGILTAWLSGARFVASMANSASMTMAIATALSLLCYAFILFIVPQAAPLDAAP